MHRCDTRAWPSLLSSADIARGTEVAMPDVTRRLAAVLAADVAGYTRLMETDEEATLAAWWAARKDVIDPTIAKHGGRIVKHTGDGFLAEFATATEAVGSAIAMQTDLVAIHADTPEDQRFAFRMGISLGEIVADSEDIYGEGVEPCRAPGKLGGTGGHMYLRRCLSAGSEQALGQFRISGRESPQEHCRGRGRVSRLFR